MKQSDVLDGDAKPYILQKDVILCRSGIQYYSYEEVVRSLGEPPVKKDFYKEFRPASVVVKAQDLCKSLPITKEHPDEWVTPDNWQELVGGVLDRDVSVVSLDGESLGEIGLKSNITFYTRDLYDYYLDNKEVSLGYTCKKKFVENEEYDILLEEITEVNHLAITRAGRGGSNVAIIDSILGGKKPMRTGIFTWLLDVVRSKENKQSDSFGDLCMSELKKPNSDGLSVVIDSITKLKDSSGKEALIDIVKDCFDNKEILIRDDKLQAPLKKCLDSLYSACYKESLDAFTNFNADGCEKKEEDEKKDDVVKKDEDEKKDEGKVTDSADSAEKVLASIKDALPDMVQKAVQDFLGVKTKEDCGVSLDGSFAKREYTNFIEY